MNIYDAATIIRQGLNTPAHMLPFVSAPHQAEAVAIAERTVSNTNLGVWIDDLIQLEQMANTDRLNGRTESANALDLLAVHLKAKFGDAIERAHMAAIRAASLPEIQQKAA